MHTKAFTYIYIHTLMRIYTYTNKHMHIPYMYINIFQTKLKTESALQNARKNIPRWCVGWHKSSHLFLVTSLLCLSLLVSLHLLLGGKVVLAGILEVLKELGVHSSHRCMNQHL